MAARKENIFRSGEMREMRKGGGHEGTQSSDRAFLGFLMPPENICCTPFPVRPTALSHRFELSRSAYTSGTTAFRKELRLTFFGNKQYAHPSFPFYIPHGGVALELWQPQCTMCAVMHGSAHTL